MSQNLVFTRFSTFLLIYEKIMSELGNQTVNASSKYISYYFVCIIEVVLQVSNHSITSLNFIFYFSF